MGKILIYFVLTIAINCMVIGGPFWTLVTSKLWLVFIAVIVFFSIGVKCYVDADSDDKISFDKILGGGLMAFSVLGLLGFLFVPSIRNEICAYVGIYDIRALFEFYDHLSWVQIAVISISEFMLMMVLLPGNKEEATKPTEPEPTGENENGIDNE